MIINLNTQSVDYWKQERLVIKGSYLPAPVHFWSDREGSYADPIAIYTPDANQDVLIDVSDYIRTYGGMMLFFRQELSTTQINITVNVIGLINPATALIPKHDASYYAYVVPPSKIIAMDDYAYTVAFELQPQSATFPWTIKEWDEDGALIDSGSISQGGSVACSGLTYKFELKDAGGSGVVTRVFRSTLCEKTYAIVEWKSFTGATRRHLWEVVKHTISQSDVTSLVTMDENYQEIKGRVDGLTLMLDGLNAYDFWYYSDVVTSSDVNVAVEGHDMERVQVTAKSVTIPDGDGANGKLEITINWRHYDAVDM